MTTDNERAMRQDQQARTAPDAPDRAPAGGRTDDRGDVRLGDRPAADGPGPMRAPSGPPRETAGDPAAGDTVGAAPPAPGAAGTAPDGRAAASAPTPRHAGEPESLLGNGEREQLADRLQTATTTFVDSPRGAVQEADKVLDEAVRYLTEALDERHRLLRAALRGSGDEGDTEELRLALRQYRELTERLLHV